MNCLECRELLQRRLDGEHLPVSLALDQHLAGCQSCRHTHAAGALLLDGLKALPRSAELPAGFAQRVVAGILRDRLQRRARMRGRVWVTASLAAAILIIVWAGNIWLPRQPNVPPAVVERNKPDETGPAPVPEKLAHGEVVPLEKKLDEVRDDMWSLTTRVAKDQAGLFAALAPKHLPSFVGEPRLPLEEPLDPAAQSLRRAGQGVAEGVTTVSRSAERAIDYFMKELPVLNSSN
jgi:hypothetical protein